MNRQVDGILIKNLTRSKPHRSVLTSSTQEACCGQVKLWFEIDLPKDDRKTVGKPKEAELLIIPTIK